MSSLKRFPVSPLLQGTENTWVPFDGGELEGRPSRVRCAACREKPRHGATLCFECHRAGLAHEWALKRAATLDTGTEARFQTTLPFEPVNDARLTMLRAARAQSRAGGAGGFAERRQRAQIAARRALQQIAIGLAVRGQHAEERRGREREFAAAIQAAHLQLQASWLPFVVGQS